MPSCKSPACRLAFRDRSQECMPAKCAWAYACHRPGKHQLVCASCRPLARRGRVGQACCWSVGYSDSCKYSAPQFAKRRLESVSGSRARVTGGQQHGALRRRSRGGKPARILSLSLKTFVAAKGRAMRRASCGMMTQARKHKIHEEKQRRRQRQQQWRQHCQRPRRYSLRRSCLERRCWRR